MKQTAVEFLQECLSIHLSHQQQMQFEGLFQQAKEMEKEQSDESYQEGYQNGHEAAMNYIDSYKCKCGRPQGGGWKCSRTDCNQNV